jgi:UBA/THIF-type NAD/FAD binding protein
MDDRTELLFGKENLNKLQNLRVAIIGIGGVGGYVFESLVRLGIKNILIVDNDKISLSNLNRQIIATRDVIGEYKVDVAEKRAVSINKNINVIKSNEKLISDFTIIDSFKADYIIDCCDNLITKKNLIKYVANSNMKIISSMGCGKRKDASLLEVTDISKTSYDPIARELRYFIRKEKLKNIMVLCSKEIPIKQEKKEISSCSYVPAVGGLLIVNYLVNQVLKLSI